MLGSRFVQKFSSAIPGRSRPRTPVGVRARLLIIVLIPSVALMGIGVGAAAYLIDDGRKSKEWAEFSASTTTPAITMIETFQSERAASMLVLAGDESANTALATARADSDRALTSLLTYSATSRDVRPELIDDMAGFDLLYASMPGLRSAVDARAMPREQVFDAYSTIIDTIVSGNLIAATVAPDAAIAVDTVRGIPMLRAGEAMAKAVGIATTALLTDQLSAADFSAFTRNFGDARAELGYADDVLAGQRQAQLAAITDGRAWQRFVAMGESFTRIGALLTTPQSDERPSTSSTSRTQTGSGASSLNTGEWAQATSEVQTALLKLWQDQSADAHARAIAAGEQRESDSLRGAFAIAGLVVLAFLAALWLTNRLIGRMRRLRQQTLELADDQLPETIRALTEGTRSDSTVDMEPLKFGRDELGQIADAFNRAHSSAVAAAVAEFKTRSGVSAVFLNIAHRSQVIVHRQLALLDNAEREEQDPAKLDVLFQLDHLATRSRRNAENLIILGGDEPGRQWRNPIPLIDVVRAAVAESNDYTRIHTAKLPDLHIIGTAVADLVHLLAELTDNATAFSPPNSRVDITGNQVGRGIALEITDQGLGIPADELVERNELLARPPDFSVETLSTDARLGLFVVAKLAERHGISVRLAESDYGGVKAIVIVPTTLVAPDGERNAHRISPTLPGAPLPRRRPLETPEQSESAAPSRPRSADQARDLMSAIEKGTRQGRASREHTEDQGDTDRAE